MCIKHGGVGLCKKMGAQGAPSITPYCKLNQRPNPPAKSISTNLAHPRKPGSEVDSATPVWDGLRCSGEKKDEELMADLCTLGFAPTDEDRRPRSGWGHGYTAIEQGQSDDPQR